MNNSPIINIRFANPSDVEQIAACHVASWQKIYRGHIPDNVLDSLSIKDREQKWYELLNNNVKILVLVRDNKIIGFASLCPSRDKNTDPKKCGEISAIYLHPDFWHQGLGKKLCQAALSELEMSGFSEVIVWALKENEQARRFYIALEFTETDHTKSEPYNEDIILNEVRYKRKLDHEFSFDPLQKTDLDLLCKWLNEPHVKEWWDDNLTNDEIKSKYGTRIGDSVIVPFIAYLNKKPIGFIQYYQANKVGDGWWPDEAEGTLGIDQFIGEKDLINRGIGTEMIREFVDHLFRNLNAKKIITDVAPKNRRAIRCYEKVGFEFVKEIMTPDGVAHLLAINKNQFLETP